MKITELTAGLRVAVKNYKSYTGSIVCYEAIVLDPAYWTRVSSRDRDCRWTTVVARRRGQNHNGFSRTVATGIPVARVDVRGQWTPDFVAPNTIVSTWPAYLERAAADEAARKAALEREYALSTQIDGAVAALNGALVAAGIKGAAWRKGDSVVLSLGACEPVAALVAASAVVPV
jgi:hypothetical protein